MLDRITDHCWVRTSRFCLTNSVVVVGAAGSLLVDPGVHRDELDALAVELHELGAPPVLAFSTHPHWDHLLWSPSLGPAQRLTSPRAARHGDENLADAREKAGRLTVGNDLTLLGLVEPLAVELDALLWDGPTVELVHHDGHAPGHVALFLPEEGVLLAGDMLSDVEVPLLDLKSGSPEPLADYTEGLARIEAATAGGTSVLVPGHGGVATGTAVADRFDADHAYLAALAGAAPVRDTRLDPSATYGPEWLIPEHEAQRAWCFTRHRG